MDKTTIRAFDHLDQLVEYLSIPRYALRPPYSHEERPNAKGLWPILLRDETRRAICLAWHYDVKLRLIFMVWTIQVRADATRSWYEAERFPRILQASQDEQRRWRVLDLCITSPTAPEWLYLAPENLRTMVSSLPRDDDFI